MQFIVLIGPDVVFAAGCASVLYGSALIYPPLAFLLAGGALIAAAVMVARRAS